jgi:NTE family protein
MSLQPKEPVSGPSESVAARGNTGADKGMALCLSGGGYRAALFHLGAATRLNELGVLSQVGTISSVSGGSIFAGHLAERVRPWPQRGEVVPRWEEAVARPFREFCGRDIRTGPILGRIVNPLKWFSSQAQVRALAGIYEKRLTSLRLAELPERPRFIFCATDMSFGVNWVFERRRVGDYQAGYAVTPGEWPVALAVAASSCFPPVFGPLVPGLPPEAYTDGKYPPSDARDDLVRGIQLTDGGVYDNLATEPVFGDEGGSGVLLVSDGGGVLPYGTSRSVFRRVWRYASVVQDQAGKVRKRWLMDSFKQPKGIRGAYWGIGSAVERYSTKESNGYRKSFAVNTIAPVRTDLDAFSRDEAGVLENHGYWLADAAVRSHLENSPTRKEVPFQPPRPDLADAVKAQAALARSHKRKTLGRGKNVWW